MADSYQHTVRDQLEKRINEPRLVLESLNPKIVCSGPPQRYAAALIFVGLMD